MKEIIATRNLETGEVFIHHVLNWEDFPDERTVVKRVMKLTEEIDKKYPAPPFDTVVATAPSLEDFYRAYPAFEPDR